MSKPLVSICIPAFRQPELLKRCLESISIQTYKNLEIIISDDSDNNSVFEIIKSYRDLLNIRYYRNNMPLGSPANWNNAIDKANGSLYLLLHHDDFLAREDALQQYCACFEKHPDLDGFFCKSTPLNANKQLAPIKYEPKIIKTLLKKPDFLIRSNQIGPPSNLMLRTSVHEHYNTNFLWLVDIEFYIRLIKGGHRISYINESLVFIGIHTEQITQFCMKNPHIVLRENILLAEQVAPIVWKNIKFYDHYWRLFRNNYIESEEDLWKIGVENVKLPAILKRMLSDISRMPSKLKFNGIISKAMMFVSWIRQALIL